MVNIDALLKQDGWTGEELGRLEIANTMIAFQKALNGERNAEPPIKEKDFDKMVKTIKEPAQGRIYNGYLSIHEWIGKAYNVAVSQQQQAQLRYNEIATPIETAFTAERLYQYVAELPAIMTEKQYSETVERRTEELLHPVDGQKGYNLFNLFEWALGYYIKELKDSPKKKNPLKPLRKKLERERVTSPRILSRYNDVMGNGYYTLPDGRRSDSMTQKEWAEALCPDVKKALDDMDAEDTQRMAMERQLQIARDLYNGMTPEEAFEHLEQKDVEAGLFQKITWHDYEEPPKDLSKWEILEYGELHRYFPALRAVDMDGKELSGDDLKKAVAEEASAFKEEFPQVVEAIVADMERHIKGVSSIPVEEWGDHFYLMEDLYKMDYYGFRKIYIDDSAIFKDNVRAVKNGIAILRGGALQRIDENGYYKAPEIRELIDHLSLLGYAPDSEDYATLTDGIELARQTLVDSLYWLTGYNKAIDIVAEHFFIDELHIASIPIDYMVEQVKAFNDFVAMFYKRIYYTDYEDQSLKEKKLGVLRDVFYPIDLSELTIPAKNIKKAKESIKDFKAFKDPSLELCNCLCYKGV